MSSPDAWIFRMKFGNFYAFSVVILPPPWYEIGEFLLCILGRVRLCLAQSFFICFVVVWYISLRFEARWNEFLHTNEKVCSSHCHDDWVCKYGCCCFFFSSCHVYLIFQWWWCVLIFTLFHWKWGIILLFVCLFVFRSLISMVTWIFGILCSSICACIVMLICFFIYVGSEGQRKGGWLYVLL